MAVSQEEFIKTWQQSSSSVEVGRILGITPNAATSRASWMRNRGIPLKTFKTGKPLDVAAMTAIAKKYAK
jgi:TctA family transporter